MRSARRLAAGMLLVLAPAVLAPAVLAADLTPDERRLLDRVRAVCAAPLEDFTPLGGGARAEGVRDPGYRYRLAFLSYGLSSIVSGAPELREEGRALLVRLVEKMERPETLAYWKALGYEGDGLARKNVMYRGHLNLMYALARDRFGERRFDERFHALSSVLADEAGAGLICCEPDQAFLQCNSVALLSLSLHDRAFGTRHADAASRRVLGFARAHLPLEGTRLVRDDFRPSSGRSSARFTGYANAWAIAFLGAVPPAAPDARAMWADWRRVFPLEGRALAAARGEPADAGDRPPAGVEAAGSALLATMFGAVAAREMGDDDLHRKLARTVALADLVIAAVEPALPPELRAQAETFRTIALFARSFRGFGRILGGREEF